jgi:hypothetical protein
MKLKHLSKLISVGYLAVGSAVLYILVNQYIGTGQEADMLLILISPEFRIRGLSLRPDPRIRATDLRIRNLLCSSVTFKMPERSGFLKNFFLFLTGVPYSRYIDISLWRSHNNVEIKFFVDKVSTDRGYRYLHTFSLIRITLTRIRFQLFSHADLDPIFTYGGLGISKLQFLNKKI